MAKVDPNSRPPPKVFIVTKESAARTQLETAISLWFHYADPISIHTLAVAANDCYRALAAHAGKPSFMASWLKTQSKGFQKKAVQAQNFVKHGHKELKGTIRYRTDHAEVLIIDAIGCHESLFGIKTDLMALFMMRYVFENPGMEKPHVTAVFRKMSEVYNFFDRDRTDFLNEGIETIRREKGSIT